MKKSLAIVSGLAVAGSIFAAPHAVAAEKSVSGSLQCDRFMFANGGSLQEKAQKPTPFTVTFDAPETATVGEQYDITATINVVGASGKSGFQATKALDIPTGSDYEYRLATFTGGVDDDSDVKYTVEGPEATDYKATVGGEFSLDGTYNLKLSTTPTGNHTEHTIKEVNFEFNEEARKTGSTEDGKAISRWQCTFTADEELKIKVNPAPATPEDPADNPATPGDENGSSKGAGILNALLGLVAGVGIFHFFVAPLFGGASNGIVAGSSNLFAFLPKEVRDFFGLK